MRVYHLQKPQKVVKENLNHALSAVSEDASVSESQKDLNVIDFTSIAEISEHNLIGELSEFSAASLVLTPFSSASHVSTNQPVNENSENVTLYCFEAELVVKHLREVQFQRFNGRTMDLQSKRLLGVMINVVIKEFYEMPHKEGYNETIPRRAYLAFVSILLAILAASSVIICFSCSHHTFNGPRPT